jgi:hypothetical protein
VYHFPKYLYRRAPVIFFVMDNQLTRSETPNCD